MYIRTYIHTYIHRYMCLHISLIPKYAHIYIYEYRYMYTQNIYVIYTYNIYRALIWHATMGSLRSDREAQSLSQAGARLAPPRRPRRRARLFKGGYR